MICSGVILTFGCLYKQTFRKMSLNDSVLPVFSHFVRSRFVRFWVPNCFSAVSGAKKLGSASSCVVLYRAFSAMVQCTKGVQFISVPEQLLAEGKVIIKSLHV
jgi:hypothetical protein